MTLDPDTGEIFAPFFRTGYNYDRNQASLKSGQANTEPSKTQQQFKEEVDINTIVRRFGLTGQLPDNPKIPRYGDFTGVTDYQTAMNAVRAADEAFMALPADVRAAFNHDPQRLIEAVEDPRQQDMLVELGLATKKPAASDGVGVAPSPSESAASTPLATGKKSRANSEPDQSST